MRVLLQEQLMNARLAWVVAHERWYQPQWNSVLFLTKADSRCPMLMGVREFYEEMVIVMLLWRWLCHGMGRDRY